MTQEVYRTIEAFMLDSMDDSAHDCEHVYRVLFNALEIGKAESQVDYDILIAACLLHDIGRKDQVADPSLCHAQVGSEKAYDFLLQLGMGADFARQVKHCIQTHRFRKNLQPQTTEAKILFDADKLDVTGAIGIARTLLYSGEHHRPLYSLTDDGEVSDGEGDPADSFFWEYQFKLAKIYDRFYTTRGREEALARKAAAVSYYESLLREVRGSYAGSSRLKELLEM